MLPTPSAAPGAVNPLLTPHVRWHPIVTPDTVLGKCIPKVFTNCWLLVICCYRALPLCLVVFCCWAIHGRKLWMHLAACRARVLVFQTCCSGSPCAPAADGYHHSFNSQAHVSCIGLALGRCLVRQSDTVLRLCVQPVVAPCVVWVNGLIQGLWSGLFG